MATIAKLDKLEHVRVEQWEKRVPWISDFGDLVTAKANREEILLRMAEYLHRQKRISDSSRESLGELIGALKNKEPTSKLVTLLGEAESSFDADDKSEREWRARLRVVREVLQRPIRP